MNIILNKFNHILYLLRIFSDVLAFILNFLEQIQSFWKFLEVFFSRVPTILVGLVRIQNIYEISLRISEPTLLIQNALFIYSLICFELTNDKKMERNPNMSARPSQARHILLMSSPTGTRLASRPPGPWPWCACPQEGAGVAPCRRPHLQSPCSHCHSHSAAAPRGNEAERLALSALGSHPCATRDARPYALSSPRSNATTCFLTSRCSTASFWSSMKPHHRSSSSFHPGNAIVLEQNVVAIEQCAAASFPARFGPSMSVPAASLLFIFKASSDSLIRQLKFYSESANQSEFQIGIQTNQSKSQLKSGQGTARRDREKS